MFYVTNRVKRDFLATCESITHGALRIRTPEGHVHDFGSGALQGEMQINDWSVVTAAATRGDIGLGQAYVKGLWDSPSIKDVAEVGLRNLHHFHSYAHAGFFHSLKYSVADRLLRPSGLLKGAKGQSIGNEFFQLWLDDGMSYSAALYSDDISDLAGAQTNKNDRILGRLSDGDRLLEVGCAWGGFTEMAAEHGHEVTALTQSPGQKGYTDARLDGRAEVMRGDHRSTQGQFDNIVSIEALERLGPREWPAFFASLKNRLAEGGRIMLQSIVVPDDNLSRYLRSSDFFRQAMVPGGAALSRREISRQAGLAGLRMVDDFAFGLSYARTCSDWQTRLEAKTPRLNRMGFDDTFLRGWRYHLGAGSAAFAAGRADVVQVELAHA
ncbi:cyclopropane-fatty-acyl-phospholipid synthase [Shimia isoporae]|uniref:Cyclopropane-fatty-acyl-phospholipid synthase n=1 Tax=Shimia isoporae TaxID=647720 RepID=A0A4R1NL44_9RHOB|nr:class I SAM-dependent methyltransferase [Shimia isoporae]TCL09057.1 cyclopropane-fatty-acyl-phospholipid synthase [Shimia isoporae]